MYCWSCGNPRSDANAACDGCGAGPVPLPVPQEQHGEHGIRVCPGCGYRGEAIGYFRRAGHVALLIGAALLTYGIGGLVYWLVKREDRVCPRCGLGWARSRPLGGALPAASSSRAASSEETSPTPSGRRSPPRSLPLGLPSGGMTRRVIGVLMALFSVLFLGIGVFEGEAVLGVLSLVFGLGGAASFAWGWSARGRRREAILRSMQGRVLALARSRGGSLTATDVAAELDLSLEGAERVLLSLDDGFRIRSDVTEEGLLVFDFPEIRWADRPNNGERVLERGS